MAGSRTRFQSTDAAAARISLLSGSIVESVNRLFFERDGQVDRTCGALQIGFSGDRTLLVETTSEWTLCVAEEPWIDPFAPPQSKENNRFVEKHGRWRLHNVSEQIEFAPLIGRRLESHTIAVENLHSEWKQLDLCFDNGTVVRALANDELAVEVLTGF